MNRFMAESFVSRARVSTQLAERARRLAVVREIAAAAWDGRGDKIRERVAFYGFGSPGIVFGRVTRCTIKPTGQMSQPSTVTSVAFGELRFLASFMIQIATKSQIAIMISWKMQTPPKMPAAAASLSCAGESVVACARTVTAVKTNGSPTRSLFIFFLITKFPVDVSTQLPILFARAYLPAASIILVSAARPPKKMR